MPRWGHVGFTMYDSVKSFVLEAGKVILAISIILWVLSSYGPGDHMEVAEQKVVSAMPQAPEQEVDAAIASARLESSYAGNFGSLLSRPSVRLAMTGKLELRLLASFAAREVFVGTMATIYSISGDSEDVLTVKERLVQEKNDTGRPDVYTGRLLFTAYVLRFCDDVHEYDRRCVSRNAWLEMAAYSIGLSDGAGLCFCFCCLSDYELIFVSNSDFR